MAVNIISDSTILIVIEKYPRQINVIVIKTIIRDNTTTHNNSRDERSVLYKI